MCLEKTIKIGTLGALSDSGHNINEIQLHSFASQAYWNQILGYIMQDLIQKGKLESI